MNNFYTEELIWPGVTADTDTGSLVWAVTDNGHCLSSSSTILQDIETELLEGLVVGGVQHHLLLRAVQQNEVADNSRSVRDDNNIAECEMSSSENVINLVVLGWQWEGPAFVSRLMRRSSVDQLILVNSSLATLNTFSLWDWDWRHSLDWTCSCVTWKLITVIYKFSPGDGDRSLHHNTGEGRSWERQGGKQSISTALSGETS